LGAEVFRTGFGRTLSAGAAVSGAVRIRVLEANPESFEEFVCIAATAGVDLDRTQSRTEPAAVATPAISKTADAIARRSRGCAGRMNQ